MKKEWWKISSTQNKIFKKIVLILVHKQEYIRFNFDYYSLYERMLPKKDGREGESAICGRIRQ